MKRRRLIGVIALTDRQRVRLIRDKMCESVRHPNDVSKTKTANQFELRNSRGALCSSVQGTAGKQPPASSIAGSANVGRSLAPRRGRGDGVRLGPQRDARKPRAAPERARCTRLLLLTLIPLPQCRSRRRSGSLRACEPFRDRDAGRTPALAETGSESDVELSPSPSPSLAGMFKCQRAVQVVGRIHAGPGRAPVATPGGGWHL